VPEPATPVPPTEPTPTRTPTPTGTTTPTGTAPYRAEAVCGDGQWHLTVRSLDDHPDRGEVEALVVTVTPAEPVDGLPVTDLDHMLRECGFTRDGDWAERGDRWTAPCRQPETRAAPPAPPIPE
jgi:hypothetical protein